MVLNRPWKRIFVPSTGAEIRRQNITCLTSVKNMSFRQLQYFTILHLHKWGQRHSIVFRVTNKTLASRPTCKYSICESWRFTVLPICDFFLNPLTFYQVLVLLSTIKAYILFALNLFFSKLYIPFYYFKVEQNIFHYFIFQLHFETTKMSIMFINTWHIVLLQQIPFALFLYY